MIYRGREGGYEEAPLNDILKMAQERRASIYLSHTEEREDGCLEQMQDYVGADDLPERLQEKDWKVWWHMSLSGHMYRGASHETDWDCGNCDGARCESCRERWQLEFHLVEKRQCDWCHGTGRRHESWMRAEQDCWNCNGSGTALEEV